MPSTQLLVLSVVRMFQPGHGDDVRRKLLRKSLWTVSSYGEGTYGEGTL